MLGSAERNSAEYDRRLKILIGISPMNIQPHGLGSLGLFGIY